MKNELYRIPESVKNNILFFLDRVDFKGINEAQAANEILILLSNPIKEENTETEK